MKSELTKLALALLSVIAIVAEADRDTSTGQEFSPRRYLFDFAKVLSVQPLYREVRISTPIRDCWGQPVYHVRQQLGSARAMLAVAQIDQLAVSDLVKPKRIIERYEEYCKTRHEVSYEKVLDGYDVTYEYRGRGYRVVMPYDPGRHIKMRIQFSPVI
jgi:uncharacterized protein YcfJ